MNFFEHQDRARSKTTQLVFLFSLAVAGIIVALYLVSRLVMMNSPKVARGPCSGGTWATSC